MTVECMNNEFFKLNLKKCVRTIKMHVAFNIYFSENVLVNYICIKCYTIFSASKFTFFLLYI